MDDDDGDDNDNDHDDVDKIYCVTECSQAGVTLSTLCIDYTVQKEKATEDVLYIIVCVEVIFDVFFLAVSMATGMSCVALEDSTDEVAVTRRHCRSLLVKLGSMVGDTDTHVRK